MPSRVLSEPEFDAIKAKVLAAAPDGLDEQSFNRWAGPRMAAAIAEAENTPPPVEGSAVGRFVGGAAEMLNPVPIVKALWNAAPIPQALGGSGVVEGPTQFLTNVGAQSVEQGRQAIQAAQEGRISEAIGHGFGTIPLIGPAAVHAGERIAKGDIAGGAGEAVGLLAPVGVLEGTKAVGKASGLIAPSTREIVAARLAKIGAEKVTDVMVPKVGANKPRLGNLAQKVAPELAQDLVKEGAPFSREGFHAQVGAKLADAEQALDAASDARLNARTFPTQPIIQDLMAKRRALMAEPVEASKPVRSVTERTSAIVDEQGKPITVQEQRAESLGKAVTPAPHADRVAAIDKAIGEIKALGPVARYDPLRTIRQAWDGPAKLKYNPSMTQDFLKNQGYANGAADVTGVLRDSLAKFDPETAKANAQYSLYRKADDVLTATAEIERVRPKVGRQIMARWLGFTTGGVSAGLPGAVVGGILGPVLDTALSGGLTMQLQVARTLTKLSNAIQRGDLGAVTSATYELKKMAKRTAAIAVGATSPSGSQSQTTAPAR